MKPLYAMMILAIALSGTSLIMSLRHKLDTPASSITVYIDGYIDDNTLLIVCSAGPCEIRKSGEIETLETNEAIDIESSNAPKASKIFKNGDSIIRGKDAGR